MIPIKKLDSLLGIKLDFKKITAMSKKYGAVGYRHVKRALGCYLYKYGVNKESQFIFEQGCSIEKPSEIVVCLKTEKDRTCEIKVGGTAIIGQELQL